LFSYPTDWADTSQASAAPSGEHTVATRSGLWGIQVGASDMSLDVHAFPPHPQLGCSEPFYWDDKEATALSGEPATLYARHGVQARTDLWVLDLIARHNGLCYQFQLVSGSNFAEADAKAFLAQVEASFGFGS
jgi:hypothetical protein